MSDQTKIATVGPADSKASTRVKLYAGLALVVPLLSFLATFNIVTAEQVEHISGIATGAIGLLGLGGFGYAASKTRGQVKNGTFDEAPATPILSAAEGLAQLQNQLTDTINVGLAGVKEVEAAASVLKGVLPTAVGAATGLISTVPDVEALIKSVVPQASA